MLDVVGVGGEQHQRAEARRADRVALGDRFGGVADRIERVGRNSNFRRQVRHFRDTAGIVCHRSIGIQRHDHSSKRQHRRCSNGDAVETGFAKGNDNADRDDDNWKCSRFHRNCQPLDHVGAVTGFGRFGDRPYRAVDRRGVVLGDPDQQAGNH